MRHLIRFALAVMLVIMSPSAALSLDLNANGIASSYDSASMTLFIDRPWSEGALRWGNTDTGLDFGVNLIPEPGSSTALVLAGLLLMTRRNRCRRTAACRFRL